MRASKVAFPSASARSLPWGLIPHPSLMIRITGCAIRRRLSHGGLSGYGGHNDLAGTAQEPAEAADPQNTQKIYTDQEESLMPGYPSVHFIYRAISAIFSVCRLLAPPFFDGGNFPGGGVFQFCCIVCPCVQIYTSLRCNIRQAPAGSNFAPARWANSTWNCDGWGAGPFSWVRPQ